MSIQQGTWVTTAKAAEVVGVTSRAIRYWVQWGVVRSRTESRRAEMRRARLIVALGDCLAQAAKLRQHRFDVSDGESRVIVYQDPAATDIMTWLFAKSEPVEPEPDVAEPESVPVDDKADKRKVRDDIIRAAVREQVQATADAIKAACADADDWSDLPAEATDYQPIVQAHVKAADNWLDRETWDRQTLNALHVKLMDARREMDQILDMLAKDKKVA